MRRILMLVAAFAATVAWAEMPSIIGGIDNEAGGEIVLMTDPCQSDPKKFIAYTRDAGGKILMMGCYRYAQRKFFVFWSDGSVYEYPFEALRMTEEFRQFLEEREKKREATGT